MAIPSVNAATNEATTVGANANITMEVTKTVGGKDGQPAKREPVGKVQFYAPTLSDFGIQAEPVGQEEDGTLKYTEVAHSWLYNAVIQAVKAKVRNSLKAGTTELKPGQAFATNLTELVTPSESTNTVLADRRALLAMFANWLANSELMAKRPENLKVLLKTFMDKPDTLVVQPADKRVQIGKFFEAFGSSVNDSLNDYQAGYIMGILEKCNAAEEDLSFEI